MYRAALAEHMGEALSSITLENDRLADQAGMHSEPTAELRWCGGVLQQRFKITSRANGVSYAWRDVPDITSADRPSEPAPRDP